METNNDIARLEQFIEGLLKKYKNLQEDYTLVKSLLEEQEKECASLREKLSRWENEKVAVGEKVADLIKRIEEWESEISGAENLTRHG